MPIPFSMFCLLFFFNDPATTEIYPLSLHDALPICCPTGNVVGPRQVRRAATEVHRARAGDAPAQRKGTSGEDQSEPPAHFQIASPLPPATNTTAKDQLCSGARCHCACVVEGPADVV